MTVFIEALNVKRNALEGAVAAAGRADVGHQGEGSVCSPRPQSPCAPALAGCLPGSHAEPNSPHALRNPSRTTNTYNFCRY